MSNAFAKKLSEKFDSIDFKKWEYGDVLPSSSDDIENLKYRHSVIGDVKQFILNEEIANDLESFWVTTPFEASQKNIDSLIESAINICAADGSDTVAKDMDVLLRNRQFQYTVAVALTGIEASSSIAISDGLSLIPIRDLPASPFKENSLPSYEVGDALDSFIKFHGIDLPQLALCINVRDGASISPERCPESKLGKKLGDLLFRIANVTATSLSRPVTPVMLGGFPTNSNLVINKGSGTTTFFPQKTSRTKAHKLSGGDVDFLSSFVNLYMSLRDEGLSCTRFHGQMVKRQQHVVLHTALG